MTSHPSLQATYLWPLLTLGAWLARSPLPSLLRALSRFKKGPILMPNPIEEALAPIAAAVPIVGKVETIIEQNPWIGPELADDIHLVADVLQGKGQAIAPDLKAALQALPIPAPWNLVITADPVVDAIAGEVAKLVAAKAAKGAVDPQPAAPAA